MSVPISFLLKRTVTCVVTCTVTCGNVWVRQDDGDKLTASSCVEIKQLYSECSKPTTLGIIPLKGKIAKL